MKKTTSPTEVTSLNPARRFRRSVHLTSRSTVRQLFACLIIYSVLFQPFLFAVPRVQASPRTNDSSANASALQDPADRFSGFFGGDSVAAEPVVDLTVTAFGPKKFIRTQGAPNNYVETFTLPTACADGTYKIVVKNGEQEGTNRISSAEIKLNSVPLLIESDFNQNTYEYEKSVALAAENTLEIRLASPPHSYVTIDILGENCGPVDTVPPHLVISTPEDNEATTSQTIAITGTAEDLGDDPSGIAQVLVNDTAVSYDPVTKVWGTNSYSLVAGTNIVTVRAIDNAGNQSTSQVTIIRDLTKPTVAIASPTEGSVTLNALVSVSGTSSDGGTDASGVARVTVNGVDATLNPISGEWTIADVALSAGFNTITVVAYDRAGNQDSSQVTLTRVVNQAPVANAGADQTIDLPNTASLSGTATDDGYPLGSSLTVTWSKVSGTGGVTFSNPSGLVTDASFSSPGTYVLRLTATDGQLETADEVVVNVNPENMPPVVDAGPDQSVRLPFAAFLNGTASDDGNPTGGELSANWSMASGPGVVIFSDVDNFSTHVSFDAPGTYVLRLSVSDGGLSAHDDVTVIVKPENLAPSVNAGHDVSTNYPNAINLAAMASDDGVPAGGGLTFTWSKLSGPGEITFADPNVAVTTATFSQSGTYVLRMTVSDGDLSSFDDIVVHVNPEVFLPIVEAGPDQTVTLPSTIDLNGWISDPTAGLSTTWNRVSGSGNVTFSNTGSLSTSATFSSAGIYRLRLTASNGTYSTSDDLVVNVGQVPTSLPQPFNYRSFNDSPWNNFAGQWFYLEDFEDHLLNTPGVTAPNGGVVSVVFGSTLHDSVDGDDGVLDGLGRNGDNFFAGALPGITFNFNAQVLGHFPTHVGLVYTDSNNPVFFEPFDAAANSLGVRGPFNFPLTSHNGEAINDFFLQVYNPGGISSVRLWGTGGGGMEADHLQYGYDALDVLNVAPVVTAGVPLSITLPTNSVALSGAVSDDGLPTDSGLRSVWTTLQGPGTVRFSDPGDPASGATFDLPGEYILRLIATDGELSTSSDLTVSVNAPVGPTPTPSPTPVNQPPIVSVPDDQTIRLGSNFIVNPSGEASLVDGEIPGWTRVSGDEWNSVGQDTEGAPFPRLGQFSFSAGSAGQNELRQDIDLTAFAEGINSGTQAFELKGYIRSLSTAAKGYGRIVLEYRDPSNQNIIAMLATGSVVSPDAWHLTEDVRVPPPGTGYIRVRLIAAIDYGSNNRVFFDGISVKPVGHVAAITLAGVVNDDGNPAGSSLSSVWSVFSGSGNVRFGSPFSAVSSVRFEDPGTYGLKLSTSDGLVSTSDEMLVNVVAPNIPPVVDAGADVVITPPAAAALNGTVTDEESDLRYRWSKVSGPGAVFLSDPSILNPTVTFGAPGSYVLRLSAEDGELETSDDVSVTVNAAVVNQPPTFDAGSNQTIQLPTNSVNLSGAASDDGLPNGTFSIVWTKRIGPGTATFADPNSPQTSVTFDAPGSYVLRLTVSDGEYTGFDEIVITVNPEGSGGEPGGGEDPQNQPPVVDAGPDQTATLSYPAILESISIVDDGRPTGATYTSQWSKVSGDGDVTFSHPTQTATYATFSQAGTYVVRLSVSDSQLIGTDDVTVTVVESQPSPVVDVVTPTDGAGLTAPTMITGTVSGGDWKLEYSLADTANPSGRIWTRFASGSGAVSGDLGSLDTTLMLNGLYDVRLTATDQYGQNSSETISLTVENNLKVGHFTVSFDDMNVPVRGLPMQIVRTYDSRDKRPGDFGIGWTLSIKNIRVEKNRTIGLNWRQTSNGALFPTYCVEATRPHIVTVTMPDGTVEKFNAKLRKMCQQYAPVDYSYVDFEPEAGTRGKLEIIGDNYVAVVGSVPGPMEFVGFNGQGIFDSASFKYTSKDGTQFTLRQGVGLEKVRDLDGNTLTISASGIHHSSGVSIAFTRDTFGRITNITDPAGEDNVYGYDAAGDLISFTDREENETTFTYEPTIPHHLKSIVDPLGRTPIRNDYDASGRLLKHTDADGNEILYTHDLAARIETVTDRLGTPTIYEYDGRGNVLKKRDALNHETTYSYDGNDNILTETNPLGKTTTYTYDLFDNRTSVTDPLGNRTEFTYNNLGQVLTSKDARGKITTNTYSPSGQLLTTTDPLGRVTTNIYDLQTGELRVTRDALQYQTQFGYTNGRLTSETDAQGNVTSYGYDANGNRNSQTVRRTNALGQLETITTTFIYDDLNRLTKTTYADGSFTQVEYNELGQQKATIDQAGYRTEFEYDTLGRLIKTTHPDGKFEESTYDEEGRRLTSKDRLGRITSYEYDALGRLQKTTYANGTFTQTSYDAAGQVLTSTDARNNVTTFTYDDAGRRLTVKNALDQVTSFTYDPNGNQTSMTDARNNSIGYVYDDLSRRTRTSFADSSYTETTYDELGRRIAEHDQAGKVTQFVYDSLGRLTKVIDALNQETRYEYNEVGQQTKQVDALNRETKYEYDKLGRRTKRTLPMGQVETYTYSTAGNLETRTDFNGKTTTFGYDNMRRLLRKTPDASLGQPAVTFTYNDLGQRETMTDASGVTTYGYDIRNRLSSKQTPFGTLSYTYNDAGNIETLRSSNASGVSVDYSYDELNRLQSVTDNRLAGSQTTSYTYDRVGNLESYTYPNQVTTSYAYNSLNRLTGMAVSNPSAGLASYIYTLGPSGNRTQVTELSGRTVNYVYDDLYRLTSETIVNSANNGSISYQHDAVGNRLNRTSNVPTVLNQVSTYDANDRLDSDAYDDNGNTKASNGRTFNYDFENRLTSTSDGVTILYDGDGNRVAKTVNGVTTAYLVDTNNLTGYAQVVEEIVAGDVSKQYTYGHDLISQNCSQLTANCSLSFYQYDGHGSVRQLTDASASVTDTYAYDAFGTLIERAGTTDNNYLYAGEQFDPDLSLYYNRARYLKVETGRFISQDTFEGSSSDPLTLHKYLYANADGVNRIDPSGYASLIDVQIVALTIVGHVARAVPTILFYTEFVGLAIGVAAIGFESLGDIPDDYINPNHGSNNPVEPYEVDDYDDLLRRARFNGQTDRLQQHHLPQKARAFAIIGEYGTGDPRAMRQVAMALSIEEHKDVNRAQVAERLPMNAKPSDLVLRDTLHLKRLTGASLQDLKNLLGKINNKYPSVFQAIRRGRGR